MGKKVLVVDDDPDVRLFSITVLEENGYTPLEATNGEEGMQIVTKENPDLIILDVLMPRESGIRLYRQLQTDNKLKQIPIILLSGITRKSFLRSQKALTEFERMMEEGLLPLMAAKNIVRCYMSLSSPEAAISQYTKWSKRNVLSENDLGSIRAFLQNILEKEGITASLPPVGDGAPEIGKSEKKDEGHLDISSISVSLTEGGQKGNSFCL